jgi:hypothetical protein
MIPHGKQPSHGQIGRLHVLADRTDVVLDANTLGWDNSLDNYCVNSTSWATLCAHLQLLPIKHAELTMQMEQVWRGMSTVRELLGLLTRRAAQLLRTQY